MAENGKHIFGSFYLQLSAISRHRILRSFDDSLFFASDYVYFWKSDDDLSAIAEKATTGSIALQMDLSMVA